MSFKYLHRIPTPEEIISEYPLPMEHRVLKEARDAEIRAVFERKSDKFVLVIGPCSADNEDALCDYVSRLAGLQQEVAERLILIPRIYTNKPRTVGTGYKGMLHQPDPSKLPNITEGIKAIRRMHLRALSESHLSAADEMLYPNNLPYLEDLLSYVAVGARSVENQQHRLTISGMQVPAGMKNPTSGDIATMFNSIQAAQSAHVFIHNGWEVATDGNPLTHAILRGAVDHYGRCIPNYHFEDLLRVCRTYMERNLANPAVIVDTNHANSDKQYDQQPRIGLEVANSRRHDALVAELVRGLMVESYIEEGCQGVGEETYGKSITDACLGWTGTQRFVRRLAEMV